MPSIVRKAAHQLMDFRREIVHAVSWQVRSNVWSPPTDAFETGDAYVVLVEIAGMLEDDFEVVLENNRLQISGSRLNSPGRRAYHQMEIRFGRFATSIEVPAEVSLEAAVAEYKHGFLSVHLPWARPRQIKVES